MMFEQTKNYIEIGIEEWAGMIVFSMTMLLTLNFNLALPLTVFSYIFFAVIIRGLYYWKKDEKKFFKKIKGYGNVLLFTFVILYLIDVNLTALAVVKLEIAEETNPFLIYMWSVFGYSIGQFLVNVLFAIGLLYSFVSFSNSDNYKRVLVNFIFIVFGVIIWSFAIIDNIGVFFITYCHI